MRDATYEQVLDRNGVEYTYQESVDLADVDTVRGIRNQARLVQPIDKELVEQYGQLARDGHKFPPLVLWLPGRTKYVPVDGNQRLAAFNAIGKNTHDAYVLKIKDQMIVDRLTWTFNNQVNGKRLTYKESREHALTFVRKYGMSIVDAAREWGIPTGTLGKLVVAARVRDVLERHKVRTKNLGDDALNNLAILESLGEDVLVKAGEVATANGLTVKDIAELTGTVKSARTSEAKLKAIDEFASRESVINRRAETKNGTVVPRTPLPRERFAAQLRSMYRLMDEYPTRATLAPVGKDYKDAREVAQEIVDRLVTIFGLGSLPMREAK